MSKIKEAKQKETIPAKSRKCHLWSVAILAVLTVLLYLNSLGGDFVWDDRSLILANPYVQQMDKALQSFTQPLTIFGSNYGYYRPVAVLSLAFDNWLWNGKPLGFHVTNVVLHLIVVLCIFFLFNRIRNWKTGFVAAILFAGFACHVENIAFVSGRMDVLAALFILLHMLLYFRGKEPSVTTNVLCALFALFAFLSKEIAFALPFVFTAAVMLFMPRQQWKKHLVRGMYIIGLPLLIYLGMRFFLVENVTAPAEGVFPFWQRLLMVPHTLVLYMQLLILPYNLNARHMTLPPQYSGYGNLAIMVLILLCAIVAAIFAARRSKAFAFGAIWFAVTIIPVLNIVPLRGQVIAERFLYLPSAGFALMLAGLIELVGLDQARSLVTPKAFIWILLAAIGLNNMVFTVARNPVWHDEESFFSDMVEQEPGSPLAHHNLGYVYYRQGDFAKAEQEYRKAIELNPAFPDTRATLGDLLVRTGRYEEAIREYKMYLTLYPDTPRRDKTLRVISRLMQQVAADSVMDK